MNRERFRNVAQSRCRCDRRIITYDARFSSKAKDGNLYRDMIRLRYVSAGADTEEKEEREDSAHKLEERDRARTLVVVPKVDEGERCAPTLSPAPHPNNSHTDVSVCR